MTTRYSKYISAIHLIGDMLMINISFIILYWFIIGSISYGAFSKTHLVVLLVFNFSWVLVTYIIGTYSIISLEREATITNLLKALITFLIVVSFILFILNIHYSRKEFLYLSLFLLGSMIVWRVGLVISINFYRKIGYNYKKVIIIGYNETGKQLEYFFAKNPKSGYHLFGFFDDIEKEKTIGSLEDVFSFITKHGIDEVFYSLSENINYNYLNQLIDFADNNLVRVKVLTDFKFLPYKNFNIEFFDFIPILAIRTIPLDDLINRKLKRAFDFIFSLFCIIFLLSWMLPVISLLIKIDSKGPIFFKQKRSGTNNTDFWCYKFRTMHVNVDADMQQANKNDPRITRVGKFLRKTNIDEFPQFFNVLAGSMSIVGPRPHMLKHTEEYSQVIEKYMVRHFVKPGITGLAQIKGYRGETKNPLLMKSRIKIDVFYIENWSFLLDLRIIFLTMFNMVRGDKNAY